MVVLRWFFAVFFLTLALAVEVEDVSDAGVSPQRDDAG